MTWSKEFGRIAGGAAVVLAVLASCTSSRLVPTDGGAGQAGVGGLGAGTGGSGASSGGAGAEGGSPLGCVPGRELDGRIVVVACSLDPGPLALGESEAFWVDWDARADPPTGTILAAPKDGGATREVAATEDRWARLRADGSSLFWTDWQETDEDGVLRTISDGTDVVTLAENLFLPDSLALDGSYAYFGTVNGNFRVPRVGGEVDAIADGLALDMQVVDGVLYWLDHEPVSTELGLQEALGVLRVPVDGSAEPELLLRTYDDPGRLVVVGSQVFWTTVTEGEVWAMDVQGGPATTLLANDLDEWDLCCSLASDGESLYLGREAWVNGNPDKDGILRISLDGSIVEDVVLGRYLVDVAADDEFVFFTGSIDTSDERLSGVFRMPK